MPVDAAIGKYFGFYNGSFNRGIDLNAAPGTVIKSPCGGTVSAVLQRGSMGLTLEISHGSGIVTRYTNLQTSSVSVGDALIEGNIIGKTGEGGLHLEFLIDGKPYNPLYYINGDANN